MSSFCNSMKCCQASGLAGFCAKRLRAEATAASMYNLKQACEGVGA